MIVKVFRDKEEIFEGDLYDLLEANQFNYELFYWCLPLVSTEKVEFKTYSGDWEIRRVSDD